MDSSKLQTEGRNPNTMNLDRMTSLEIVTIMNQEDRKIPIAIEPELPKIAKAVDIIANALKNNGRLFYIGAGTSGRLGVLDASECPPTFGVSDKLVVGLIAGGDHALRYSIEKAEDDLSLAEKDLKKQDFCEKDILVGIAASGRTPYVIGGLKYANSMNAKTISIACSKDSEIGKISQITIEASPDAEILTGSTRLKAGTTQKLILNMLTTASMVRTGRAYENLMVDVVQSNTKLVIRAENIVMQATGVSREKAKEKIAEAKGNAKIAIVMILKNCDAITAKIALDDADGFIYKAINKF